MALFINVTNLYKIATVNVGLRNSASPSRGLLCLLLLLLVQQQQQQQQQQILLLLLLLLLPPPPPLLNAPAATHITCVVISK